MTNAEIGVMETLSQIEAINAVVDNYNEHKSEKNKALAVNEPRIVSIVDTPFYNETIIVTGRNDGLLYSIQVERHTGKVSLYLYNRIARKILKEGVSE